MKGTPILVAEDDQVTREMLVAALQHWGYAPTEAIDGHEALEALRGENKPRLAIIDWMMPKLEGPDVCRALRDSAGAYVYVMLLTNRELRHDRLMGLESGADDFLTKPFDPEELRLRLRTGARIVDLQDRLQSASDALQERLDRDALTGAASREALFQAIDRERSRAQRTNSQFSVVMVDIDRFKDINDEHGHAVGDRALRHVTDLLQSRIRPYDTCGRFGGDEFVLVLPNTSADQAFNIAERVRQAAEEKPLRVGDKRLSVRISAGVATSEIREDSDVEKLVQSADEALYIAKKAGRNQVASAIATVSGRQADLIIHASPS